MNTWLTLLLMLAPATEGKRLIQYGWDSPDTAFLRKNLKTMEASPFDGIMLTVRPAKGEGKLGGMDSLGWMVFLAVPKFTPEQYQHAIDDLVAAKSSKFTDHFLAVISHPAEAGFDWFDEALWASVTHNIGVMAKVAKAGGCAGLMFDPEEYNFPLWSYGPLPDAVKAKHSYDEYAAKVRERGRSFMQAINVEFADVQIVTLFGPSLFAELQQAGHAQGSYSLLGPFYDGMIEGATGKTTLVDGYEQSYGYKAEEQFTAGRENVLGKARALSKAPREFAERVRCGFGIWLDHRSLQLGGWFPPEAKKNHFTPEELQSSLRFALKHSDKYVWVYNERARWWDDKPGEAYEKAMVTARSSPGPASAPAK